NPNKILHDESTRIEFKRSCSVERTEVAEANEKDLCAQRKAESKTNQKDPKKRKQRPELNPAVDTDMKPELIVNYVKLTVNGDLPSQIKKKGGSNDGNAERCSPKLLDGCKQKTWWKKSNGITKRTKRKAEAELVTECTHEEETARQERKLNQPEDLIRTQRRSSAKKVAYRGGVKAETLFYHAKKYFLRCVP
ncbi:hypothetical protein ACTXT7_015850, partial [Hymenolepis weldensis]